jgi:hypothetical protein
MLTTQKHIPQLGLFRRLVIDSLDQNSSVRLICFQHNTINGVYLITFKAHYSETMVLHPSPYNKANGFSFNFKIYICNLSDEELVEQWLKIAIINT